MSSPLLKHLKQVWRNFPRMSDQQDAIERIAELEAEKETWDGHKVCELLRKDVAELEVELDQAYGDIASIRDDKNKRIAKLEQRIEWSLQRINYNEAINERLRAALQSIAANTCCEPCQEAALVAKAALKGADDE